MLTITITIITITLFITLVGVSVVLKEERMECEKFQWLLKVREEHLKDIIIQRDKYYDKYMELACKEEKPIKKIINKKK